MLNRSLRIDGAAPSVSNRRAAGFSLVEALIALALGTWLVSAVGLTAQRLSLMARLSSDEVELAERGDFALRHLSQALLGASPITEASIDLVKRFGIEPKVALLSHSNFGTSNTASARKMRRASELLRDAHPQLEIDGEMHVLSALNPKLRKTIYSKSTLEGRANVLVMPNLDAANIAMGLIRSLTDALLIGPFINGFSKPAHIVIPSVSSRGIFNMTALTVADIQHSK